MDITIIDKRISSCVGCIPDEEVIVISTAFNWNDTMYYIPASDLGNVRNMSLEDYITKAVNWESLLISLGRVEGIGIPILLDLLAWENRDVYYTFFPEDL